MFSNANFEIFLKRCFHPKEKFTFKDVIDEDNAYLQTMSALIDKNINYYLKNLEIIVQGDAYKLIDLKYNYYDKNENISKTNIQIYFV